MKFEDIPASVRKNLETIKQSRRGLYLHGGCGTGKTHVAYAIAKHFGFEKNFNTKIFGVAEILRLIRSDFDRINSYKEEENTNFYTIINYRGLLILDDLGAEKITEWAEETLYAIVNKRYEEMLPTIFTSNLNLEELAGRLGDRIVSRIAGSCDVVELQGKDKRLS